MIRKKSLSLFRIQKLRLYDNIMLHKATLYRCVAKNKTYSNIRFKSSDIIGCSFKNITFDSIDFIYCNFKGTKFKNCKFKSSVFFAGKFDNCEFRNCDFDDTYFISINIKTIKGLSINKKGLINYNSLAGFIINDSVLLSIVELENNIRIFKNKVIHVKENKINMWIIKCLLKNFTENELEKGFKKLSYNKNTKSNRIFFTYGSYKKFFDSYLQR